GKACRTLDQLDILRRFNPAGAPLSEGLDHVALALANRLHIDRDVTGLNTIFPGTASNPCDLCAGDHRLGWCTAVVHTGATRLVALNNRRPPAVRSQRRSQWSTGLP